MKLAAPLLWRQLALEASHGRTFWVRPLFGIIAAGALVLASGAAGLGLLDGSGIESGHGRAFFDALMWAGMLAVYLGLPMLVAPAVAAEEERGTLDLLRIAGIRPLALVGQLVGARLAMAATIALAAAPLAALAYACGGVSDRRLLAGGAVLAISACQVAACSAAVAARRLPSAQAAMAAYRDVVVHLIIVLPLGSAIFSGIMLWSGFATYAVPWTAYQALVGGGNPWHALFGALLPAGLGIAWHLRQVDRRMRRRSVELPPTQAWLMSRWRPGPRWQKEVRRWRLRHGLDRAELPDEDALAWRAQLYAPLLGSRLRTTRLKVLGCFLPVFATIALFNTLAVLGSGGQRMTGALVVGDVALAVCLALVAHAAAVVLPRERAHGTLEVLAASPLSGAEVARGLSAGSGLLGWRAGVTYAILLAFCALVEFRRLPAWPEAVVAAASAFALAGALRWGGLALGARFGQPLAAGTAVQAAVACLAVGPWLAARAAAAAGWGELAACLAMLNPLHLAGVLHLGERDEFGPVVLVGPAVWAALWLALRWWCRRRMDAWLGRSP